MSLYPSLSACAWPLPAAHGVQTTGQDGLDYDAMAHVLTVPMDVDVTGEQPPQLQRGFGLDGRTDPLFSRA